MLYIIVKLYDRSFLSYITHNSTVHVDQVIKLFAFIFESPSYVTGRRQKVGRTDIPTSGLTDGDTDVRADGRTDERTSVQTDRQTDRQAGRQTRHTDTDRQADRQTDREMYSYIYHIVKHGCLYT